MYLAAIDAARKVQKELRHAFPQIRFNVATVGASIFVAWENGPGRDAVKQKIDRFEVDAQGSNRVAIIASRFSTCSHCKASLFQAESGNPIHCRICSGAAVKLSA